MEDSESSCSDSEDGEPSVPKASPPMPQSNALQSQGKNARALESDDESGSKESEDENSEEGAIERFDSPSLR